MASSSRIATRGYHSERFRISNIVHRHQRKSKIHHRLFDRGIGSDGAKCKLSRLIVFLPFEVRGEGIGAVMVGLKVIFPCLDAVGYDGYWHGLSS